jgi:hypothetical protein
VTSVALLFPAFASAAARFAEPGAGGSDPSCPQADPCDIEEAVNSAAVGDDVTILPGDYTASNPLIINGANTVVHGEAGQPRPVIQTSAPSGVFSSNIFGTVRDLEIRHTGSGTALFSDGTAERVIARSSTATACTSTFGTIRDSTCWATSPTGIGLDIPNSGGTTITTRLRNVTLVATGSFGLQARAMMSADLTVDAKSVIAKGSGADVRAQTDGTASTTAVVNLDHSNYASRSVSGTGASVTIQGSGTNQIAAPLFANAAAGDFHQAAGSPTINAGAVDAQSGTTDYDGEPRTQGPAPDIGADEFDQIAPSVAITAGPGEGEIISSSSPTFEFTSDDPSAGFNCGLGSFAFGPCTGPGNSHTLADLPDGAWGFSVRAVDANGNSSTATRNFVVANPPETTITKSPPNRTQKERAKFKFSSDEPGSTFRCKLDRKPFKSCASPRKYKKLDEAKHKFRVQAIDPAGNVDPSPAKDRWKVLD